jgi:hypothetical protein
MAGDVVEEAGHPPDVGGEVDTALASAWSSIVRRVSRSVATVAPGDRTAGHELEAPPRLRIRARPLVVEPAQRAHLRRHRLAFVGDDGRTAEARAEDGLAFGGVEAEREQPARERFPRAPELLVDAAPVLGGQEPTGAVRAFPDPEVARVPAIGLERVDGRPFPVPPPSPCPSVALTSSVLVYHSAAPAFR